MDFDFADLPRSPSITQTEPDPYILRHGFKQLIPADDPILEKVGHGSGSSSNKGGEQNGLP